VPLHEVVAAEGDPGELSAGKPKAKVRDYRILNRAITKVASVVRGQQSSSRTLLARCLMGAMRATTGQLIGPDNILIETLTAGVVQSLLSGGG
jgi:hypothetical protein